MDWKICRSRHLDLNASYATVKAVAALLGMPSSWCVDPGRLEDAVAGTAQALLKRFALKEHNYVALDCSNPCCHGLEGIFGQRFVQALRGRVVMLDLDCHYVGDRVEITHWGISLGASEPAAQDDEEEVLLFV